MQSRGYQTHGQIVFTASSARYCKDPPLSLYGPGNTRIYIRPRGVPSSRALNSSPKRPHLTDRHRLTLALSHTHIQLLPCRSKTFSTTSAHCLPFDTSTTPTPPMYYYQPQAQAQAQAQVQVQPQVVHAAAPPPPPPSAMMQVPPPPPSHVHSYAPPSLPQSPPLYQPQTVPIVNVNLNNAHNKKRKKYMCDCGRSFTTSGHLARHMRIHTGEKNYQCPYEGCTSRFSRQDNCMQHYRTHLGTSRNSMMRRKSGTVSPPPGQVSKPKQEKAVERKMSNFLSTVLVT